MKFRFSLAVVTLFIPLCLCFAFDVEYWPYSHFPLFVRPPEPFRWVRIMGMSDDGGEELLTDPSLAQPYGLIRLSFMIDNLVREGRESDARQTIADLAAAVRRRRLAGNPVNRTYRGLRVYFIEYAPGVRPYSDQRLTKKKLVAEEVF